VPIAVSDDDLQTADGECFFVNMHFARLADQMVESFQGNFD